MQNNKQNKNVCEQTEHKKIWIVQMRIERESDGKIMSR